MANKLWKVVTAKVDNASGTLTTITGDVNNVSVSGEHPLVEDTGFGDSNASYLAGLVPGAVISMNGFINGTTEAIFAPLVGVYTSITKSVEVVFAGTTKKLFGECFVGNVTLNGAVGELSTWSADFTFSVAPTFNTTGAT